MFQITNPNTIIDLINEEKIELALYKGKEKADISQFLDDVSLWMDKNRMTLTEKYLPFCALSVGITPIQVSAFMYGLFVGKAIDKHGLTIKSAVTKMTKDEIVEELRRHQAYTDGILGKDSKNKEKPDDGEPETQGVRK